MVGFKKDSMAQIYRGKTIAEAALMRNQTAPEAIIDLILEDDSRIQCIYFSMSPENLRNKMQIPWVSFCSDAGTYSDWKDDFRTHPRAFGSFVRVLSEFTIKEQLLSMASAIHHTLYHPWPLPSVAFAIRGLCHPCPQPSIPFTIRGLYHQCIQEFH